MLQAYFFPLLKQKNKLALFSGARIRNDMEHAAAEHHHLIDITDLTIHAAAKISLGDTYEDLYETNVVGTKNIIKVISLREIDF